MFESETIIEVRDLNFYYGNNQALEHISIDIYRNRVTALIGPSGCGKSTFLRCLNRMNDTIPNTRVTGQVLLGGEDIYHPSHCAASIKRRRGASEYLGSFNIFRW